MEEPSEIEHWKRISVLGSGAFGVVSLWQHKKSDDYIAIKKCKFKTNNHITDKQRKRWENEVNIMKTLNCNNIVSFKPLPKHLETVLLKYNPTKLPLLSMEYCTKGNLRRVINQPKNLCGLEENEVKTVLADITHAVSYLHKFNITHRDIKPENIVLQECNVRMGGVIYKLIDLGYAKELNDSVVSFVGTLHYLAPEIIKTENYNHSVDYWSLGTVAFEIICGVLPFLPQYTPVERFQYIEKKKPEHICIYQLHSGSVAHSSELLKENHISTCLKQNIEIWLRHVLQYDPSLRMMNFSDNTNVFDYLLNILNKKIVNVFSIYALEFYSYEINESTLISTLKDWIARDTKVQKSDQVLLSNFEKFDITDDKYVIDLLEDDFNLFMFRKGAFINRQTFTLPKYVKVLFENCTKRYGWRELRLLYAKSLFFLTQEDKIITSLLTAFKLYTGYIFNLNMKLKTNMQQIHKDVTTVIQRVDCYYNIHNNNFSPIDMDRGDEYKKCLLHFKELIASLERCIHNTNKLLTKVGILSKRQIILDKMLPNVTPVTNSCDMSEEVLKAIDLLNKVGNNFGQGQELSCMEMVRIVSNALKKKDKLLNNKNFKNYAKLVLTPSNGFSLVVLCVSGRHRLQLKM
ncbi:inhibitor of nuclear factor kappa-B kinase subunit beta-like [Asbolus verrucosus]|uniref:IkappaB kinase n=1 Tax=Asbolus verrucosus TaxID=1661398 RepID=A0A482V9P7_ASBVE|nr:inhibitor of nuclear factor kappa-B kinase subunit beta-like [Asbolus verrucosus]